MQTIILLASIDLYAYYFLSYTNLAVYGRIFETLQRFSLTSEACEIATLLLSMLIVASFQAAYKPMIRERKRQKLILKTKLRTEARRIEKDDGKKDTVKRTMRKAKR